MTCKYKKCTIVRYKNANEYNTYRDKHRWEKQVQCVFVTKEEKISMRMGINKGKPACQCSANPQNNYIKKTKGRGVAVIGM